MNKIGFIYILASRHNTTLYIGVTADLRRRVAEHKLHLHKGFSDKYNVDKLVYFEGFDNIADAILREKQLKKWHREWKERLINEANPGWVDLSASVGVDEAFLKSIQDAFDDGTLWPE